MPCQPWTLCGKPFLEIYRFGLDFFFESVNLKYVMADDLRLFIAIDVPDEIREMISQFQKKLRSQDADIKWVKPSAIHITLKFLGNTAPSMVEPAGELIRQNLQQTSSFPVELKGTGTFPNDKKPRVLWIGIQQGADNLSQMAGGINHTLESIGFDREKRAYSPHLTIGRVRSQKNIRSAVGAMHSMTFKGGIFTADEVLVMKSDLQPGGAVYTPLKRIKLKE